MVTRTGLQQLLVSCVQMRSFQYVPSEVRVTFNQIHAHERVHGETTEADEEKSDQQRDEWPRCGVLTSIAEQDRSGNTSQQWEYETDQVCLRLSLSSVPLGVLVADLVGQVSTEEPDERSSGDHRQDDQAQLGELELETENNGRGVLCRGREGTNEDGVEGDDPEDVGEEGGLDGLDDGAPAQVPLEGDREKAEVVLVGAVTVPGVVQTGPNLTRAEGVDCTSSCISVLDPLDNNGGWIISRTEFVLRALPSCLGDEEDHRNPHNDTGARGDVVEPPPAEVNDNKRAGQADADNEQTLTSADE